MSSTTKPFEEKMNASVNHLIHELASIRAGRANPAILDKVTVDYYGSPTPIQQIAAVAVAEARILTISPWDRSMLKPISKAIQTSDIGTAVFQCWSSAAPARWAWQRRLPLWLAMVWALKTAFSSKPRFRWSRPVKPRSLPWIKLAPSPAASRA